ncbi:MAG: BrnT family toxin [Acidimicrobiales bacterium]
MAEITELLWDDQNIAHIAHHEVTPFEVSEVVFGEVAVFASVPSDQRPGRLVAYGRTASGRGLVVYLDTPTSEGRSYVVTARPMTRREARDFESAIKKGDDHD